MKIEGYTFSEELRYDLNNSYARQASDTEIVQGITDLGQAMVGEALYVEAPFVGRRVRQGERLLSIQPMDPRGKVIRLTAAVSGEIVAVNPALEGDPSVINEAPYDEGWLVVIRPDDVSEMSHLHSPDELPFRVWVSRELEDVRLHEAQVGRKVSGDPVPSEEEAREPQTRYAAIAAR